MKNSNLPTEPYDPQTNKEAPRAGEAKNYYTVGVGSSIGIQREHNEDAVFSVTTNLLTNQVNSSIGLYIVADGMGGHLHGEIASELAVHAIVSSVIPGLLLFNTDERGEKPAENGRQLMEAGIDSAHQAVLHQAPGGGTTLTAMLIIGNQMTIAHIGDSRAYHIDDTGNARVLTTDHSLVKRLQDLGQITSDEAAIHPQRNVLYRALGQVESIDPEFISAPIPESGYLLLCSDGLWGVVPDQKMVEIIHSSDSPQQACQALLQTANAAGGPDNISVIIIKILQ